jgi:hypothetical protein
MKYADINLKGSKVNKEPVNKSSAGNKGLFVILAVFICLAVTIFVFRNKIKESLDPISVVASVRKRTEEQTFFFWDPTKDPEEL